MVIDNEAGLEHISRGTLPPRRHHATHLRLLAPGRAGGRQNCGNDPRARAEPRHHEADHQPRAERAAERRREGRDRKSMVWS